MIVATPIASSTPAISEAERARRLSEVTSLAKVFATSVASCRTKSSASTRYVAGEITSDELPAAILASNTVRAAEKLVYPSW